MEPTEKIKALQQKLGIEANGIASAKTWLHIYYFLFEAVPYDLNMNPIIKAIQQKINVRADGYPWTKTWDTLYDLLIDVKEDDLTTECDHDAVLKTMTAEVRPFAKELVLLAAREGIHVKIINDLNDGADNQKTNCKANFGLYFNIGIYEKTADGELIYKDVSSHYHTVAKLGESIGLTWRGCDKSFTSPPKFEIRPAWAVQMNEDEMLLELNRRKKSNLNLLAIF